jgi:hypothetical protein
MYVNAKFVIGVQDGCIWRRFRKFMMKQKMRSNPLFLCAHDPLTCPQALPSTW